MDAEAERERARVEARAARFTRPPLPSSGPAWVKIIMAMKEHCRTDPAGWTKRVTALFREVSGKTMPSQPIPSMSIDELGLALRRLGIALGKHELEAFRADVDCDGDGSISLEEFMLAASVRNANIAKHTHHHTPHTLPPRLCHPACLCIAAAAVFVVADGGVGAAVVSARTVVC